MKTVSLEMAKKLKKAGLQWEPKEGDWFATSCSSLSYVYGGMKNGIVWGNHNEYILRELGTDDKVYLLTDQDVDSGFYGWSIGDSFPEERELIDRYFLWLPTLSDLLEWLENKEYVIDLFNIPLSNKWIKFLRLWRKTKNRNKRVQNMDCDYADTWEDAAGKAVLWVLESDNK